MAPETTQAPVDSIAPAVSARSSSNAAAIGTTRADSASAGDPSQWPLARTRTRSSSRASPARSTWKRSRGRAVGDQAETRAAIFASRARRAGWKGASAAIVPIATCSPIGLAPACESGGTSTA